MNNPNNSNFRLLSLQLWLIAGLLLLSVFGAVRYCSPKPECTGMETPSTTKETEQDTLQVYSDSIGILNEQIIINKRIEDSLQIRIDDALDTLDLLGKKLQVMQNISDISAEVVLGIVDSMEMYRKQTFKLKQEIDSISKRTAKLLHDERDKNHLLRVKIEEYERRLMALYAININIGVYRDGFDSNRKLRTTTKAAQVEEIVVEFKLTRELHASDEISIRLDYSRPLFEHDNIRLNDRVVTHRFKIDPSSPLRKGSYYIVILHENPQYHIERTEIGRGYIRLD